MDHTLIQELVAELEAEVNNGGFDQFFFNSSGDRTKETVEALMHIGAVATSQIVEAAAAKFPGGMPSQNRSERQDQLELVSPEAEGFEEQDEAFLAYADDLETLVREYVGAT